MDTETALIFHRSSKGLPHDCIAAKEDPTHEAATHQLPSLLLDSNGGAHLLPFHAVLTSWRIVLRMCSTSKTQRNANWSACSLMVVMSSPFCAFVLRSVWERWTTLFRLEREEEGMAG